MASLRDIFIRNLKFYRKERNIRQLDLALEIGKSSNYINSIENGKYFPSPETIEQIAAVLKINPMTLFDTRSPAEQKNNTTEISAEVKKELIAKLQKSIAEIIGAE